MMKKKMILIVTLFAALLAGCSAVEEVGRSVNYTSDAAAYINDASQWAQELPEMAQNAATDPQAQKQLQQELDNIQKRASEFAQADVPEFAQGIHQQLSGYNETLNTQIDNIQQRIQAGDFTPEMLQNTEVMQTLQEIRGLMDQVQQLGQ